MCGAETRIERTDGGTFVVVPVNRGLPNPRIPSFGEYLDKTTSEIIEDLTDLFFNGTVSDEPIRCWGISMEQPTESELKRALKAAVKREDYELAAQLRDQINQL